MIPSLNPPHEFPYQLPTSLKKALCMLRCPALDRILSVDMELKASIRYSEETLENHGVWLKKM